jgi:hypothetical protein
MPVRQRRNINFQIRILSFQIDGGFLFARCLNRQVDTVLLGAAAVQLFQSPLTGWTSATADLSWRWHIRDKLSELAGGYATGG